MKFKKIHIVLFAIVLVVLVPLFYYLLNVDAVNMGITYLLSGDVTSKNKLIKDGDFSSLYSLLNLDNGGKYQYINSYVSNLGLKPQSIRLTSSGYSDIFVTSKTEPSAVKKVLFVAHYDTYQSGAGALDNLGSVSVLLASLRNLKPRIDSGAVSVLFTTGEEDGLVGSKEFVDSYMINNNLKYDLVINLDCVGGGQPIIVSSSNRTGLLLNFFPFGEIMFDGRKFVGDIIVTKPDHNFDRSKFNVRVVSSIVGYSDTYSFTSKGMNALHLSSDNMKAIMDYSHTHGDTSELLDQNYMDSTKKAVVLIGNNYR